MKALVDVVKPGHLISLGMDIERPSCIDPGNHLTLQFADVVKLTPENEEVAPTTHHMRELIEFGNKWDGSRPMVIHCRLGKSRSPAAAYILMCLKNPGREAECARLLRDRGWFCWPNRLMVRIADQVLGCHGRMIRAMDSEPFSLDIDIEEEFSVPVSLSDADS